LLPSCMFSCPKACGPQRTSGMAESWSSGLVDAALGSSTPSYPVPSLVVIQSPGRADTLVCASPKTGSTALYEWLFQQLSGHSFAWDDDWVQDINGSQWRQDVRPFLISPFVTLPPSRKREILSDPAVQRFAVVRSPDARLLSVFYDKVSCQVKMRHAERVRLITQLMALAPLTASAARARIGYDSNGLPWCLTGTDFARMIAEVNKSNQHDALDWHFQTQTRVCGLEDLGYHRLIPIEEPDAGFQQLARALGKPPKPLPRANAQSIEKKPLSPEAMGVLEAFYAVDRRLLNYAPASGALSECPSAPAPPLWPPDAPPAARPWPPPSRSSLPTRPPPPRSRTPQSPPAPSPPSPQPLQPLPPAFPASPGVDALLIVASFLIGIACACLTVVWRRRDGPVVWQWRFRRSEMYGLVNSNAAPPHRPAGVSEFAPSGRAFPGVEDLDEHDGDFAVDDVGEASRARSLQNPPARG